MAPVHNVLRRSSPEVAQVVLGKLTIDFRSMTVRHGRDEIHLTHREFELLRYLVERRGRVVSRHELLREIWGYADEPATRSVDHAIARLRKKTEADPGHPRFIHTVHGDGYTITPEGRSAP
jgi:two-component system alkaline phosphatase synthesis response regulator PhoP